MLTECHTGETLTLGVDDLTRLVGGAVTSGATVVISIVDGAGAVAATTTITSPLSGDDWRADLDAPNTPGSYFVTVSATDGGKVWRGKSRLTVNRF